MEPNNGNNLFNLIKQGNQAAFNQVFNEFFSPLCGMAFQYLKEVEGSEEIVQDVFVSLWTKRDTIEINTSLKSYLYTSVRNACLNQIKHINIRETYKQHNEMQLNAGMHGVDKEVEGWELEQKINSAINELPTQCGKIFYMNRMEGLRYKEIAEKLDISPKTVENQIGKALKLLRTELAEYVTILIFLLFVGSQIGVNSFLIVTYITG